MASNRSTCQLTRFWRSQKTLKSHLPELMVHQRSIKLLVLSPLMVSVSWNSLKQRWMNNHSMYNITKSMGIQMFVLPELNFPCAIILIKRVLSAIVFIPKIRKSWSAIYVINGFIKNAFPVGFF